MSGRWKGLVTCTLCGANRAYRTAQNSASNLCSDCRKKQEQKRRGRAPTQKQDRRATVFPKWHPAHGKTAAQRRQWIVERDMNRIEAEKRRLEKRRVFPKQPQTPAWHHWPEYEHLRQKPSSEADLNLCARSWAKRERLRALDGTRTANLDPYTVGPECSHAEAGMSLGGASGRDVNPPPPHRRNDGRMR